MSHMNAIAVFLLTVAATAGAQFSNVAPEVAQQTQVRGYWANSSTGLMWSARDNGKRVSWHKATRYCRNLRVAGFSGWRLATIDELESLVNLQAYATEHVGSSDILHWNGDLKVNGGLLLTEDRQWSKSPQIDVDGRPVSASYWYFNFREGRRRRGFEDWAEGDTANALCVREERSGTPKADSVMRESRSTPWSDLSTGLTWAANDNGSDADLAEVMKYCRELQVEKISDWKLATIEELETLHAAEGEQSALPGERKDGAPTGVLLTGDPWSSSPASDARGTSAIEWYLNAKSKTRVFDEPSYRKGKRALCVRGGLAVETQQGGYWRDPSTGLMWAGKDNFSRFIIYSEAAQYCRDLRLAHLSDWRVATLRELQGIFDPKATSAGAQVRMGYQDPEPLFFHVKGDLFLTGAEWVNTGSDHDEVFFDFQTGAVVRDEHHSVRERRALCVRGPSN